MKTLFTIVYGLNLCEFSQGQGHVVGRDETGREVQFYARSGRMEVESGADLFTIFGEVEKEECAAFLRFLMMIAPRR